MFSCCSPKLLAEHCCVIASYSFPRLTRRVLVRLFCAALAALAVAQDGYSYGAPPTPGYDYKEPTDPFGAGNDPGGAVVKVRGRPVTRAASRVTRGRPRGVRVTPIWQDQGPLSTG